MKIIELTPQNSAFVAGLMKKVFSSYGTVGAEMGWHYGPYSRKNKRLPKICNYTRQEGFFPAVVNAKKSGVRVASQQLEFEGTLSYWLRFGDTIMFNGRQIFVIQKNIDSPGKIFTAFVPDWQHAIRQDEIFSNLGQQLLTA